MFRWNPNRYASKQASKQSKANQRKAKRSKQIKAEQSKRNEASRQAGRHVGGRAGNQLSDSKKQNPSWEANSSSASQEIPRI